MNISRCVDEAVCYEMIKYKKNGGCGSRKFGWGDTGVCGHERNKVWGVMVGFSGEMKQTLDRANRGRIIVHS